MSFLYGVRSYHCEKIHFVRCYTFKKQGCNIEHSKNKNQICGKSSLKLVKKTTLLVAIYESEWFIAEVAKDQSKATRGYVNLSYTCIRGANSFTWPSKPDIILTLEEDIVLEPVTVEPVNSRGNIGLKNSVAGP